MRVPLWPEAGLAGRDARRGSSVHSEEEGGLVGETSFPPTSRRWSSRNRPDGQLRVESIVTTLSGVPDDSFQALAPRAPRLREREGGPSVMSDILLRAQVRVQTALYSLRHRQEGQGLVEYGLIIASIAILLIIAMLFLAGKIDDLFSETGSSVESPGPLP